MLMHQQQLGVPFLQAYQGTASGVKLAWRDWKKIVVAKNAMRDIVAGQTLGPGQAASSPSAQEGDVGQIPVHHTVVSLPET